MARIMLVDDAAFMRMTLKKIVEANGHVVCGEAANGIEAIDNYKACKPDIVLMDITMPEMDGIQAAKSICQMDPEAKVVMVSAMGQQQMVFEAINAGAKDFIVKPFEADRIIACLNKYV